MLTVARLHALGIFFGFMAGGIAFGCSSGALLTAFMGWQMLFWIVAMMAMLILAVLLINYKSFWQEPNEPPFGFVYGIWFK